LSNWVNKRLINKQIEYACNDVLYLNRIYEILQNQLVESQFQQFIYNEAIASILIQSELDVYGYNDLFNYNKQPNEGIRKLWLKQLKKFEK
jgi:ribonuclease D